MASKKTLVIVESPTKARTISRFLGSDFVVESSFGHIRDLPKSKLGVDPEKNFEPHYIVPLKARVNLKKLKTEAGRAQKVILATDEDREGEAIAWHLAQALGLDKTNNEPENHSTESDEQEHNGEEDQDTEKNKKKKKKPKIKNRNREITTERIVFHEITKSAIEEALKNPRELDIHLVDAQQARRILDRLVGYKLSPFLWKKMYRGLSAGRVQSVAVRLIVEREREIDAFKPEEYWTISALLKKLPARSKEGKDPDTFEATLSKINGKALDKFEVTNTEETEKITHALENAAWTVESIETKSVTKNSLPPFTTSTLQQDAFRRLGFASRMTMRLAQQLYEGVDMGEGSTGLITYMRTDSLHISEDALAQAHGFIKNTFGGRYALPASRKFKTKSKGAQEAHEAVRPTDPSRTPESIKQFLDPRQYKLYTLIWERFIATQMPPALFDATAIDVKATPKISKGGDYTFHATGQMMKFDGFLKVYPMKFTENDLPKLVPKDPLTLEKLTPDQHFTEPPPRYTEASLIKILEKYGIGRPSTYAPTISTIQDRGYVEKYERRNLKPTETGIQVNDLLVEHFPKIVDREFTAKMEEELDEIASGERKWQPVIKEFYGPFIENLEKKFEEVKKQTVDEITDELCEKCRKPMVIKMGRFGKFMACSGFPDCKNAKAIKKEVQKIDMKCPKCSEGDVIIKYTRRKKLFYGCSRYPACDFASWTDPRQPAPEPTEKPAKKEKKDINKNPA